VNSVKKFDFLNFFVKMYLTVSFVGEKKFVFFKPTDQKL
jgi:hypothetical protein